MESVINTILNAVLVFLPTDPLYTYITNLSLGIISSDWIHWLNWFVPVHDFIVVFGLWLVAVLIYLAIKLFMNAFEAFKPV